MTPYWQEVANGFCWLFWIGSGIAAACAVILTLFGAGDRAAHSKGSEGWISGVLRLQDAAKAAGLAVVLAVAVIFTPCNHVTLNEQAHQTEPSQ